MTVAERTENRVDDAVLSSHADPRVEPQPPSMAISRYEELVAERLYETQPVKPAPAWRRYWRAVIAGMLLVILALLAVFAFRAFPRRTEAPNSPANVTEAPRAAETPTHTLERSPPKVVPAPPPPPPRAAAERAELPGPSISRAPRVTHTQAVPAAAVPAPDPAKPRTQASSCSDAVAALGLCRSQASQGRTQ
jgi:hypothetical protein